MQVSKFCADSKFFHSTIYFAEKKWIFCFILGFVLIVFALSIAITPVGVVLPCKCQGIKPTSPIKGGDTILVAELTQCQKPPNISLVHQDGRTRINDISVFFTSCDNLHIYVINFTYSFVEISTPIHWLLDKDQDNYFLPNTQVNITLNIYSDTTNETLVVCLLNFRDHDRLQQSTTVGERLDVVKEKNCTEIRSNSLSFSKTIEKAAHYFVAIVSLTDAAPDSLKGDYNVSISRHFYNHSDFQTDEKCTGLSSRKHCIEDFNSSSNCIVLYAAIDPEGTFFDNVSTVAEAVPFTERHELIIPTIVLPILGICVLIIAIVSVCYCMNRYRKEL